MNAELFAKRLKELMELEGVSKRALSKALRVDRKSILFWQSGNYFPRYDRIIKLAIFFEIRIDNLLGLENAEKDIVELTGATEPFCEDVEGHFLARVSAYMKEEGLTRYAFAKKVNVDQKALIHWFIKGSMPETATIIRLARLMKISVDELLGRKI